MKLIIRMTLLVVAIGMVQVASAATVTPYTSRASFDAVSGSTTIETFDSYQSDVDFKPAAVDVGDFSVSIVTSNGSTAYNFIDAVPILSSETNVNGTGNLRVLTVAQAVFSIVFDSPITAFGADFKNLNDQIVRTNIEIGLFSHAPTVNGFNSSAFLGFVSDTPFTTIQFVGVDNDGFGIDNVTYGSDSTVIPTPTASLAGLVGFGLVGLIRRRKMSA